MPEMFEGLYEDTRHELEVFVRRSKSRSISDDDLMTATKSSNAAKEIRAYVRSLPSDSMAATLENHLILDAAGHAIKSIKNIGTRTIRGFIRGELDAPGLFPAFDLNDWRNMPTGLFQLNGEPGRTPLQHLRLRETFLTFQDRVRIIGTQANRDEKAVDTLLRIIDREGDGGLTEKGPSVYQEYKAIIGDSPEYDYDDGTEPF